MSVENQVGDSPGKGVAQKMDDHKPTVLEEKSTATEEVVDHSLKDEAITTQSDEVTESSSFSTKEDSPSAVRRWFEDLSAKERVSALSFVDRSFLGALLELASWSEANAETLEFGEYQFYTISTSARDLSTTPCSRSKNRRTHGRARGQNDERSC